MMKQRGVGLTIWLTLILLANAIIAVFYIGFSGFFADLGVPMWSVYVFGLFGLANVVFTIFLFRWQKWAFFAYCGVAIVALVINLITGLSITNSLLGLLGPIILYLFLRPKWKFLE